MIRPPSLFFIICLSLAVLLFRPTEGWALGGEAHKIVALVAERLLQIQDSPAQSKIAEILASDKSNEWTKTDIASEATWADALREKSTEGRIASSKWHYVKLAPDNPDLQKACYGRPALGSLRPASHGPQDDCIVDKIEQFARELRDPETSGSERLMALQFLLNLVGDIHDPLYAIEHNDQAGHCVAVLPPGAKTPVRLDAYWEDTLVTEAEGKDPAKAAEQITAGLSAADVRKWSGGTPEEWAQESFNIAKAVVYNLPAAATGKFVFPVQKGQKEECGSVALYHLDKSNQDRAIVTIKEQLAKAGVRLAALLRDNLK
jgi:hypothetical protein